MKKKLLKNVLVLGPGYTKRPFGHQLHTQILSKHILSKEILSKELLNFKYMWWMGKKTYKMRLTGKKYLVI